MAETKDTTIKTYEFKLRVNKSFAEACEREMEHSRQIYNAALAERISCYQITGESLGYVEQSRHLTDARTLPEVKSHLRTIQQDALERVDEAFKGFFRRVQNGENPGFPRFKGKDRYHTFSQKYERVRPCWGNFFTMTKSKAENAGRTFEKVDPRYTSQICSRCGHRQKMPLAIRVYECSKCGFVIGRDHNSAITIDRAGQARIYARGDATAHLRSGNAMAELNKNRSAV